MEKNCFDCSLGGASDLPLVCFCKSFMPTDDLAEQSNFDFLDTDLTEKLLTHLNFPSYATDFVRQISEKIKAKIPKKRREKNLKKNSRNNFQISTNFYILSAWKDHHSQQKPLKPGQAKNSLKEFLK